MGVPYYNLDFAKSRTVGPLCRLQNKLLQAWHQVDSEKLLTSHEKHWWQHCGFAIAIFLNKTSYTYDDQVSLLQFFRDFIAPWLGAVDEFGVERWKSFMTDDSNPIELSWDWSTTSKAPTIRLSMEPISQRAGTPADLKNELGPTGFLEAIVNSSTFQDMKWFYHFDAYFNCSTETPSALGDGSKIFWAFNLDVKNLAAKAYFTPRHRANTTGETTFQVITEAIEAAPECNRPDLEALYVFQDYVQHQIQSPLEVEALSIDLVQPSESRLKIYFRSRQTSFKSVCDTMTLDGRLLGHETDNSLLEGLRNLRYLWDSLFKQQRISDESPLPGFNDHETAGILYYADFRLGDKVPRIKVYLPVRHYAENDWDIMNAVSGYMFSTSENSHGDEVVAKNNFPKRFVEAMCDVL